MTRWKKDATTFDMKLCFSRNRDGSKTMACRIPKPVLECLGNPQSLRFELEGDDVRVKGIPEDD